MNRLLIVLTVALFAGCSKGQDKAKAGQDTASSEQPQPTPVESVIDTMTQRGSIEAGVKATQKVKAIRAEENKNVNEAMENQ